MAQQLLFNAIKCKQYNKIKYRVSTEQKVNFKVLKTSL